MGVVIEKLLLKRLYKLDPLYGLLLTFGLALIVQGVFLQYYGSSGQSYDAPEALSGAINLGFMILPKYRGFVVGGVAGRVLRHLVPDRAHAAWARCCARAPRTRRWCRPSASTCR